MILKHSSLKKVLILLLFGRVPKKEEKMRFKGIEFKVLEVKNNMVTSVLVSIYSRREAKSTPKRREEDDSEKP